MAISDIIVVSYLVDTRFLSAFINTFYKSTTVIDCLRRTLEIKYVTQFSKLLAVARDGGNPRTDFKNTSPNPFCVNKYLMLCNHGWSLSHAILNAAFSNTLLVPWQRRNQYFTASPRALCSNGYLASSPWTAMLLAYLPRFSVRLT